VADTAYACVDGWEPFDRWTVGQQLVRAADSIGANIAEAYGRGSSGDRRRFIVIARGSALELEHWTETALARDLDLPRSLRAQSGEISRMLHAMARRMGREAP